MGARAKRHQGGTPRKGRGWEVIPIYTVGKLTNPKWVKPAVEVNLALGNAKGKGNASLRRRGIGPIDNPPHPQGMNRGDFYKWFYGRKTA